MPIGIFLNLSNHPISIWQQSQLEAAKTLGYSEVMELPKGMPLVPPEADTEAVLQLAHGILNEALALKAAGAYVAGEFSLTYALVCLLEKAGIRCYTATTERISREKKLPDGTIGVEKIFSFVQWRPYRPD